MTSTISGLVTAVEEFFERNGDKRVANLTFMDNPWEVMFISLFYVYFCYDLGPHRIMKSREAFNLVWTVRIFNTFILLLNVWLLSKFFTLLNWGYDIMGCAVSSPYTRPSPVASRPTRPNDGRTLAARQIIQTNQLSSPSTPHRNTTTRSPQAVNENDQSDKAMEHIAVYHVFLYSRILELIDTLWITLRKKNRQITFLHVFHHSFVLNMTWFYFKLAPGGSSAMFPIVNGMVHTIMYVYYILSTFESMKPYLWWKKYVTKLQLFQFIVLGVHFAVAASTPNCQYPRALSLSGLAIACMFFTLFIAFYRETYTTSANSKKTSRHEHPPMAHSKLGDVTNNNTINNNNNNIDNYNIPGYGKLKNG
jgi:hypothetical protein